MNEKHVILVAGYDFRPSRNSFETICINRMNRLIKISRNLKFTLFDFKSGRVQMNQRNSKGDYRWEVIAEYEPITSDNYDGSSFKRNPEGVMSVTDVYKYVQDIGEKEPSSIVELSFFFAWLE